MNRTALSRAALRDGSTRLWTALFSALCLACVPALAGDLAAQEGGVVRAADAASTGLTLEQALSGMLDRSPRLELEALRLDARAGELRAAAGAFDSRLSTSVRTTRDVEPTISADGLADGPAIERNSASYVVGLSRQFRSGISVQPYVEVTRSGANAVSPHATAAAAVRLAVVVPLLRDRWGAVSRTSERAVRSLLDADTYGYDHVRAAATFETAAAYWRYAAAHAGLDVQRASAERASRLVRETTVLVDAGERPAADLNQVRGNLAGKQVAVLRAEQQVLEARRDLGIAMGIAADEIPRLERPITPFPRPVPSEDVASLGPSLVALALANRRDLAAAAERAAASATVAEGARQEARSRLDLSLSAGYTGLRTGVGFDRVFSSLYSHVPGMNLSVQLTWEAPLANDGARGLAAQSEARHAQARVSHGDLARQLAADVHVALEAIRRSAVSVARAEEAVRLNRTTVENERVKHQLGSATLFDVILAEDALTSVLLSEVATRLDHAVALANLRFQTGTLLSNGGPVIPERLYTLPEAGGR